jgi:hypothetical protein
MMNNGSTAVSIIPRGKANLEVTSVGQLTESQSEDSLRRTRSSEQKNTCASRQAVEAPREAAAGRTQRAEQGT